MTARRDPDVSTLKLRSHPRRPWLRGALAVLVACSADALGGCACGDDETTASSSTDHGGEAGEGGVSSAGQAGGGAGAIDAGNDARTVGPDAEVPDAGSDNEVSNDAPDAPADVAIEAPPPVSVYCGDAIRDPVLEECDDGPGSDPDACDDRCHVTNFLPAPGPPPADSGIIRNQHALGLGRHPVAAGPDGFAVAMIDTTTSTPELLLSAFDTRGKPVATPFPFARTTTSWPFEGSDPVLAPSPQGGYFAAWTDLNGDGSGRGIALRHLNPSASIGKLGPLSHANTTTFGAQEDPDVIWTGSELVVAWVDRSNAATAPDVRYQRFGKQAGPLTSFGPIGGEQTSFSTSARESLVTLAPFAGSWAIAYWASDATSPRIEVRVPSLGASAVWSVSPIPNQLGSEQPALVELDPTRLLAVFSYTEWLDSGTATSRIAGAVLDRAAPGSTAFFPIDPLVGALDIAPQSQPAAARAGNRVYIAWYTEGEPGDPVGDELWLKQILWTTSGAALTVDLSAREIRLPRFAAHRQGNQFVPALAATPLGPEGALAVAWDDHGRVFGDQGVPEVIAALIPTPVARISTEAGLE